MSADPYTHLRLLALDEASEEAISEDTEIYFPGYLGHFQTNETAKNYNQESVK